MKLALQDCGEYTKVDIPFHVDLLNCHELNQQRYPFLLESHQVEQSNSNFDILFAFPGEKLEASNVDDADFFCRFDESFNRHKLGADSPSTSALPFRGGWFVFLSYELIGAIEPKLSKLKRDDAFPIASAVRIPLAIIKDHKLNTCSIVCESGYEALIDKVWADIQSLPKSINTVPSVIISEDNPESFLEGVKKIKGYLIEGDTLQVNLSRNWTGVIANDSDYIDIYRSLKKHNPSPFAGLARFNDSVICSSSPERLVSCLSDTVQMRPIAGTCPRDEDTEVDKNSAEALLLNAKENAEHIMLIDLIRNDLGRICKTGSVSVDEKMILESYSAVHHIVSNVSGVLLPDMTPSDIIKAVFPGGTITGCPKVRCMEIIEELEETPRGAYTGSMGYINKNGDMDLNILIRSFTVKGKQVCLRTGAGIVADSVADNELQETRHKAKGLLNALNIHDG